MDKASRQLKRCLETINDNKLPLEKSATKLSFANASIRASMCINKTTNFASMT